MASRSVGSAGGCATARGPVSSTTRPRSIELLHGGDDEPLAELGHARSRNAMTSGKLWPVSTCMSGNGNRPGQNAFSARRRSTIESLPPEKSSTGPLELGGHLAHDVDGLGFEDLEMGDFVIHGVGA
jgi:hypothetical protein